MDSKIELLLDYNLRKEGMTGIPEECGDTGIIREKRNGLFLVLIDALGHGAAAFETALQAEEFIKEQDTENLTELLEDLHRHMHGTRGLVIGLCLIDLNDGKIRFSGIGNIFVRIYGPDKHTFVSRDGVVGYSIPSPMEHTTTFGPGDTLILSSDGLSEHISQLEHPCMLNGNALDISDYLFRNFRKEDDASCIVVRYRE